MGHKKAVAFCLLWALVFAAGCRYQGNHTVLIDTPSERIAGVATERGILVFNKPNIKQEDIYPISQYFGNSRVHDEAKVILTDANLALLEPLSSKVNRVRFLRYEIEPEEELYIGVLDDQFDPIYLPAEWLKNGEYGDFVICPDLQDYAKPTQNGYEGVGVYAYRGIYMWLVGVLTSMTATIENVSGPVYPFVGIHEFVKLMPELKDRFERERLPFRPDYEHGVKRDGSGD